MKRFYRKTKTNFFNLALEKCVKSEYIQELCNMLPLTVLTVATKSVLNWLIVSRITTGNDWIDFPINLSITIGLSYYSSHIYGFFERAYGKEIDNFSKRLLDNVWLEGWSYLEMWKTRMLGGIGALSIVALFFVEISSKDIQLFIIHTMIASGLVDWFNGPQTQQDPHWNRVKIVETPEQVLSRSYPSYERLPMIDEKRLSFEIIDDYRLDKWGYIPDE